MGRIDYAINPDRQDHLMGHYSTMEMDDWQRLADENQEAFSRKGRVYKNKKTKELEETECIEAKEFQGPLPNSWANRDPYKLAKEIAERWKKKYKTDILVAIHWNKSMTNYHMHCIVAERIKLETPEIVKASRNFYYDENWKRCKKAEAVHTIHKGDEIRRHVFKKTKEEKLTSNYHLEHDIKNFFADLTGLERFQRDGIHIPQQHVDKYRNKAVAERIRADNASVKKWNAMVDTALEIVEPEMKPVMIDNLKSLQKEAKKKGLKWREELPNILEKFENEYSMNVESDWNEYLNLRAEIERLENNELPKANWAVTEAENRLKEEQSKKSLFHSNREGIKEAKKAVEWRKEQAEGIRNKIKMLKNTLDKVVERMKNIVPKFFGFAKMYEKTAYSSKYKDIQSAYKVDSNQYNIEKNIQKAKEEHENHIKSLLQQQKLERENQPTIHRGRGMGR